jgi:hypothetical protein
MFKFQFTQLKEPNEISWNSSSLEWPLPPDSSPQKDLEPLWKFVWDSMTLQVKNGTSSYGELSNKTLSEVDPEEIFVNNLRSVKSPEIKKLQAAYTLASCGKEGYLELRSCFHRKEEAGL